jgi:hypothetical protein
MKKSILFMLFLSNLNFVCQASTVARRGVPVLARGVTAYTAPAFAGSTGYSSPVFAGSTADFMTKREINQLEYSNDDTFKDLYSSSSLNNDNKTMNKEFMTAFAVHQKNLELAFDIKQTVNNYYQKRDALLDYLKVPKNEWIYADDLITQEHEDRAMIGNHVKKRKNLELNIPASERLNPSVMRTIMLGKITLDRLQNEFEDAKKGVLDVLAKYNNNLFAVSLDNHEKRAKGLWEQSLPEFKRAGSDYASEASKNNDFPLVLAGGYDARGRYVGVLGGYDKNRKKVNLEEVINKDLSAEDLETLKLLNSSNSTALLPAQINLSLPAKKKDSFVYDINGKMTGDEGTRNADGELEEID